MDNASTAYLSSIPADAVETVVDQFESGQKRRAKYSLGGVDRGERVFSAGGRLQWEWALEAGRKHGMEYQWHDNGQLSSAAPWADGKPHGVARQWDANGRLLGTYTMEAGTGTDIWWQRTRDDRSIPFEVHHLVDGLEHGVEWRISEELTLLLERSWRHDREHGIEREWGDDGALRPGFPKYWIDGKETTREEYLGHAKTDALLPPDRREDDRPVRPLHDELGLS